MTAQSRTTRPDPAADPHAERKRVLSILARAQAGELAAPLAAHRPDLELRVLRKPETGLVMLRGRDGGDGAPFNLGEATMSRAVIELSTGERGYGQSLGRNIEQARLAAIVDALWQRPDAREAVEALILAPIAARLAALASQTRAETAATKVDFFTLVRGED